MKHVLCSLVLYCGAACLSVGDTAFAVNSYDETTDSTEIKTLQEMAAGGDADAQFNLGTLYQRGDGVRQDDIKAVYWFRKSADQGNSDGQEALGFAYRGGFGVPMDRVLSYMWFDLAARQGDDNAASLRSSVAELMTYSQISEARSLSRHWKPGMDLTQLHTSVQQGR